MLFFGEHGVLKEGACTLAIRISGNDEHALERANVAHGLARLGKIRRGFAAFEVALEVGISDPGLAFRCEGIGDAENDEPSALGGVEDASSVGKSASFIAEFADLTVFQVENLHRRNGLGYFLAIGADVLYRRPAHAARNTAETFDAGAASHDGARDEFVPGFPGSHIEKNFALLILAGLLVDALKRNLQHEARPTSVGDHQVAAAAEDEERQIMGARERNRLLHFSNAFGIDEIPCRASDFDGGQWRERDVFKEKHEWFSIYTPAELGAVIRELREFSGPDANTGSAA